MTFKVLVYAFVASLAGLPAATLAAVGAGAPVYQGELAAKIAGPRRIATASTGQVFVADAQGRLHFLTRRGGLLGVVMEDVAAVAAGQSVVYAVTLDGQLVHLDPRTGRAVKKVALGVSEAPAAAAYDAATDKLWLAFNSGAIQARRPDGAHVHDILPAAGAYRYSGISIDAGTVWVMQDRTGTGGTMHAYDAATGAFQKSVPVDQIRFTGGFKAVNGKVYVSDAFAGKVEVVGATGASVQSVGQNGTAPGQLSQPAGVGFLANGDLIVANMNVGRIERFGDGSPLPTCPGDSDCDGLPDDYEIANGLNPNDPSDALADLDHDGLNCAEEYALGTNPRNADTDGDGYSDGAELASGFDPRNPDDHRPQVVIASPGSVDPGFIRLSASVHDPVGDRGACSIRWAQTEGTPVVLRGATTTAPAFVARSAGAYKFQALATCGTVESLPTDVVVNVNNVAPRADGGRVVTVAAGGSFQLSAAFTRDANADAVTYAWEQVQGPAAVLPTAGASLSGALSEPGTYVFRLAARDAAGAEGAAEVPVVVVGDAVPAAAVASPVAASVGETVALDASKSARGPAATFGWEQVGGPAVTLQAAGDRASFVAPAAGRYAFRVSVAEGGVVGPPALAEVFVGDGALPVARASAPTVAAVDAPVTLDGSGSTGASLTYAWKQVSGPAAGLTRADRAAATAVLFEPGSYVFELVVTDGASPSLPVQVRVEGRARAKPIPVAVATAAATAVVGDLVVLDGRASSGATRYRWTQVAGPWVPVEQPAVGTGAFVPAVPGVYGFDLEVDDGAVRSAPVRVVVTVLAAN